MALIGTEVLHSYSLSLHALLNLLLAPQWQLLEGGGITWSSDHFANISIIKREIVTEKGHVVNSK